MNEDKFDLSEKEKEEISDTKKDADSDTESFEIEFDEEAIKEREQFDRSVELTTKKMIIGSAVAFGIVLLAIMLLAILL